QRWREVEDLAQGRQHRRQSQTEDLVHGCTVGIGVAAAAGTARPRRRAKSGWKSRGAATSRTAIPWINSAKEGWMPTSCSLVAPARKAPKKRAEIAVPAAVPPPTSATAIPSKP